VIYLKILAICDTIDLKLKTGCTPAWWQILKSLNELGADVIVVPFMGESVESLWWKSYENPYTFLTSQYLNYMNFRSGSQQNRTNKQQSISENTNRSELEKIGIDSLEHSWRKYAYRFLRHKWKECLIDILQKEKDVDYVVIFDVPLIIFEGLVGTIRSRFGVRTVFYDGDAPVSLPKYWSSLRSPFNVYFGADLSEFDAVLVNSKGVTSDLKEMGALKVETVHWGADPDLYSPMNIDKTFDIFFYGHGELFREKWIHNMLAYPSEVLTTSKFVYGGNMKMNMGKAESLGHLPISLWRRISNESKINLNITRKHHAEILSSSTSRVFELASLGCCIVSNPINGLNDWFEVGKEIFVAENEKHAIELYKWLLDSDEVRTKTGNLARERVLKEHTFKHRAKQMARLLSSLK
jgi:glycosyltransferase involved in cell wall biosynthesis